MTPLNVKLTLECPATGNSYQVAIAAVAYLHQNLSPQQIADDLAEGAILHVGPFAAIAIPNPIPEQCETDSGSVAWEVALTENRYMLMEQDT
jgi:hypothetical protein